MKGRLTVERISAHFLIYREILYLIGLDRDRYGFEIYNRMLQKRKICMS